MRWHSMTRYDKEYVANTMYLFWLHSFKENLWIMHIIEAIFADSETVASNYRRFYWIAIFFNNEVLNMFYHNKLLRSSKLIISFVPH